MRLWHYQLIPFLPNDMLVSQWRECVAIKRQWEKGTLNHKLVNYVMKYDRRYFMWYVNQLCTAISDRGIKWSGKLYLEIKEFCNTNNNHWITDNYPEHNDRYFMQCYFNLQEKYDRSIITEEEWQKIYNEFKNFIIL